MCIRDRYQRRVHGERDLRKMMIAKGFQARRTTMFLASPRNWAAVSGPRPLKPLSVQMQAGFAKTTKQEFNGRRMFRDCLEVTKFKLSSLNTAVAVLVFMMQPGDPSLGEVLALATATQSLAMASQGVNQVVEVNYDRLMKRTENRPLPKNRLSRENALALAGGLYLSANTIFALFFPTQAIVAANTILWSYVLLYTPLKRVTESNTLLGAVVGAMPPYLGWAATGLSLASTFPLGVALYIFAWQFPHFYGILWMYKDDYKAAGFQMLDNPAQASFIMKVATALGAFAVAISAANGSLHPIGAAVMAPLLWKYSLLPISCLLYTSPSPRDRQKSRMPSSA
eukprot:TRINITY_DN7123_c0_g1_i1.p1 TRINITY_DN7123_c0_g1~~TRINITY_DN7123_c0_g1_i1.p1  ORF type:complete len:340 (+),score=49.78 TRINITY_DN7123_c0_g1_i1:65-1084(+)